MCRLAVLVTLTLTVVAATARADEQVLPLDKLLVSGHQVTPATITHARDGWHLRGLVSGGVTFSSTEYCDELAADTMELATTSSAISRLIEASTTIGRDLMDGKTVALVPKYTLIRGDVMPGNERNLTLLVGFAGRN